MSNQNLLKEKGLKATTARIAVLDLLDKENNPTDVVTIADKLNTQTDQATIYRILDVLTQKEIINKLEFGEGKYRYEINSHDHHHLICNNCGRIEDIEDKYMEKFEKEIKDKKGFLVKSHSLEFFGVCKPCQI